MTAKPSATPLLVSQASAHRLSMVPALSSISMSLFPRQSGRSGRTRFLRSRSTLTPSHRLMWLFPLWIRFATRMCSTLGSLSTSPFFFAARQVRVRQ
ncbi:hypothetical protein BN1723_019427 [Verticillium longisporum]|uniref:Uncharacterized protein n=1 Tax=Verticillium longisporum TaxID=100787 RepID=A0A0G4NDB5_VERLO|nr:hypothetical protein BN1723_019427 [Verticillium longisporum]